MTYGEVQLKIGRKFDVNSMKGSAILRLRVAAARLVRAALWVGFALVLVIPKVNRLRRQRALWNLIRVVTACVGAAMIALGVARGHELTLIAAGVTVVLFAAVVSSERPEASLDARARELGALIAVDGGRYIGDSGSGHRAKLLVGSERLWVLDTGLQVILEVPLQQIRAVSVEPVGGDWSFRVDWDESTAQFLYEGTFAEHLARVAEATMRSRLHRELPVLR